MIEKLLEMALKKRFKTSFEVNVYYSKDFKRINVEIEFKDGNVTWGSFLQATEGLIKENDICTQDQYGVTLTVTDDFITRLLENISILCKNEVEYLKPSM